jgi:hypothetical protein
MRWASREGPRCQGLGAACRGAREPRPRGQGPGRGRATARGGQAGPCRRARGLAKPRAVQGEQGRGPRRARGPEEGRRRAPGDGGGAARRARGAHAREGAGGVTRKGEYVGLRGGYASAKQNFQPHKTKNYCGYRSWNYH